MLTVIINLNISISCFFSVDVFILFIFFIQNLLYASEEEDSEIRLVDFGFARMKPANRGLTTPCFTLHYAAPEVLQQALKASSSSSSSSANSEYDESCDLWSLGILLASIIYMFWSG